MLQVSVNPRGTSAARVESMPREAGSAAGAVRVWEDFQAQLALAVVGRSAEEEFYGADEARAPTPAKPRKTQQNPAARKPAALNPRPESRGPKTRGTPPRQCPYTRNAVRRCSGAPCSGAKARRLRFAPQPLLRCSPAAFALLLTSQPPSLCVLTSQPPSFCCSPASRLCAALPPPSLCSPAACALPPSRLFAAAQVTMLTARELQSATAMAADAVGGSGLYASASLGVSFSDMTFVEEELQRWPTARAVRPGEAAGREMAAGRARRRPDDWWRLGESGGGRERAVAAGGVRRRLGERWRLAESGGGWESGGGRRERRRPKGSNLAG